MFILNTPFPGLCSSFTRIDTLPDGRAIYDLSPEELQLFSDPGTRPLVTGSDQDIQLNVAEKLYLLGALFTVASPSLKPLTITKALPGLTKLESGIAQSAKRLLDARAFKKGIAAMRAGQNSEISIDGIKIVFQSDGPFSGFTLFAENGFVIGREALRSSEEVVKTVLHECYRLSTSAARSKTGVSQPLITQETNNVVNFVEKAFKILHQ